MPPSKRWPYKADGQRLDAIALQLDIEYLGRELYHALREHNIVEAARLNLLMVEKARKAKNLLYEAGGTLNGNGDGDDLCSGHRMRAVDGG